VLKEKKGLGGGGIGTLEGWLSFGANRIGYERNRSRIA